MMIGSVGVNIGGSSSWAWRDGPRSRGHVDKIPAYWGEQAVDGIDIGGIRTSVHDSDAEEHRRRLDGRANRAMVHHPNGTARIYSVCVTTPDFDATIQEFEACGLELRRLRKDADPASPLSRGLSMAFFKFGAPPGRDVILELVGPSAAGAAKPNAAVAAERAGFPVGKRATIAGMVLEVPAIAPLVNLLGPALLGEERAAAQGRGRQIAPLRHVAIGLPLPLAFITPSTQP